MMTDAEKLAWGKAEHEQRLADIAAVKAGQISLEEAQKRARRRQRESGMTRREAYRAMVLSHRPVMLTNISR